MPGIPAFGPDETNPYFVLTDAFNAGQLRNDPSGTDDEFFSVEDADLCRLPPAEFRRCWLAWFRAAQATNDRDVHVYAHGAVAVEPGHEGLLDEIRAGLL